MAKKKSNGKHTITVTKVCRRGETDVEIYFESPSCVVVDENGAGAATRLRVIMPAIRGGRPLTKAGVLSACRRTLLRTIEELDSERRVTAALDGLRRRLSAETYVV